MKKYILVFLLVLTITSCWQKNQEQKEETWTKILDEKVTIYDGVTIESSKEKIAENRFNISADDIDLLAFSNTEPENSLLKAWKKFLENIDSTKKADLTKRVDWWIEFEYFMKEAEKLPVEIKRDFDLNLEILDSKTGEKIKKWSIYLNWIKFWNFENWEFKKSFVWPKWIEKFSIMGRADGYGDGFLVLNSFNWEGSFLGWELKLKKLDLEKKISLDKWTKIDSDTISINIPTCSLVDNEGKCFKWNVTTKVNFIKWEDVNSNENISLNMRAITKEWKIVNLESGGMAFTDFISDNWDILQVKNWDKIEITYKVSPDDIALMQSDFFWNEKNGYWLYDKNKNIWIEKEAEIKIDPENNTWTAIVSDIY